MIRDILARAVQKYAELLTSETITVQSTDIFSPDSGLTFTFEDGFNLSIRVSETHLLTDAGVDIVTHTVLAHYEVHLVVEERERLCRIIHRLLTFKHADERRAFFDTLPSNDQYSIRSELFNYQLAHTPSLTMLIESYTDAASSVAAALKSVIDSPINIG